jgi:hypothetical protein
MSMALTRQVHTRAPSSKKALQIKNSPTGNSSTLQLSNAATPPVARVIAASAFAIL